ncbi:MAG: NUDIX domain-containing protein [Candidatus Aenigmarchaeota archaeon]|nr:NUDIX domain-containing protein [Candidatus Aenigmarchaeota archaeon]
MELHRTVSAVIRRGNKFLLVRRRSRPEKGFWAVPGGHVEQGERLPDAMRRELEEEVGGGEIIRGPVLAFTHDVGVGKRHRAHVFLAGPPARPRAGSDAEKIGWFTLEEMREMDLTNYTLQILNRLYKNKI